MPTKQQAKEKIQELVQKYEAVKVAGQIGRYTEEDTKKDFIIPLFETLGWDVYNRNVVTAEEQISGSRVDYGFYCNGRIKFYLEAKPLRADLHREEYAKQSIQYSWNKGVVWAVLTDFESLIVFNALSPEKSLAGKRYFEIPYTEYISRFEQLWLLSKEAFEEDLIDTEAEKVGKKLQKISVNEQLSKDLNECRQLLAKAFVVCNPKLDKHLIDEGVQKLLNRLIFIRVAEDRKIEPPTLRPLINQWIANKRQGTPFGAMIDKFRELDKIYNSSIFKYHPFEEWEEYAGATEKVIEILYGTRGYVEYDFSIIPADVLGCVYENYLGYKFQQSGKKNLFGAESELGKDARKRKDQGIYYTPSFVVDYIVKNALGPVLNNCRSIEDLQKIKVLDPACGSGSFLIKAMDLISEKYQDFGMKEVGVFTKIQILTQNIYGVDLDEQAVEIARLNLLLNTFDAQIKLPDLNDNIKNGNSLISGSDEELKKYFGKDYRDKKPFNWQEEFPEVFKQGGFDCIIGNPPYLKELDNKELFQEIRKSDFGKYYQGKMDFWYFFLHRAINLTKDEGIIAFITNSYFLKSVGATKLIDHLKNDTALILAVDFQDIPIFGGVSGRHLIHIWKKIKNKDSAITKYIKLNKESFNGVIDGKNAIELMYKDIIKDSSISFEQNNNVDLCNTIPLGDLYDVSQGVVEATDKVSKKAIGKFSDSALKAGDGVFVLSEQELEKLNLSKQEKTIIKPYLDPNSIERYYISFDNEYLIYSDKESKVKIANGDYPRLKGHLDKVKQFITSSNAPYGLHRPRENRYFESPKLICKNMFLFPEFCFDDEKYYVGFSFSVIIQKDKNYNLKYLLGLLNSNFAKEWFNTNGKKRGIGVDIGVAVFRKFPVYKANKDQQKHIATLVDEMILLNKEVHKTDEGSNKWHDLKSKITKTDHRIDEEIYKLYDLIKEDIKIIEEKIK